MLLANLNTILGNTCTFYIFYFTPFSRCVEHIFIFFIILEMITCHLYFLRSMTQDLMKELFIYSPEQILHYAYTGDNIYVISYMSLQWRPSIKMLVSIKLLFLFIVLSFILCCLLQFKIYYLIDYKLVQVEKNIRVHLDIRSIHILNLHRNQSITKIILR